MYKNWYKRQIHKLVDEIEEEHFLIQILVILRSHFEKED